MEALASAAVEQVALAPDGEHRAVEASRRKVGRAAARAKHCWGSARTEDVPAPGPPPAGLPVAALWDALAEAAAEEGVELGLPAVRAALWRRLSSEPGLRAALPPGCAQAGGSARLLLTPQLFCNAICHSNMS